MSRAGEEMVLELASLLETDVVKTAAKKEDEDDKKDKKEEKAEKDEKKEKKDDKEEKKEDKKASVMVHVLRDLVKLAGELDDLGADKASSLVDEALRVITDSIEADVE